MNVTRTLYLLSKYIKMDDIHGSDQVAVEVLLIFLTFIIPLFFLVNLTKCKKQAIILFSGIWLCTAGCFMNTYIKHAQYIIKQAEQEKTAANISGKDLKILQEGGQEAIRLLEDLRSSFREGSTEWNKITGNIEKLKTPGGKPTKGDIRSYNEYLRNQRVIKTREVNKENLKREELGLQPVRVRQRMPTGASYTRSTGNETKDALRDIFAWNGKIYLGQKAKKLHAAGRLEAEGVNIIPEGDEFVLRVPEGTKTPDQIFLRDKQTGVSYEARSGAFSEPTPSAGTAPTTEVKPGENLESGLLNNVPEKKTPPAEVEPKTQEPSTESGISTEPVSKKTVSPKVEATGPEAPPPKKFDPTKFTLPGADIQLPPSTERGESFVKKLIQSGYDSYQLHPESLPHNPMSSTGLGDALFNTIIGDIRNSTHLSVAEKQDALAALYKQVENGSIPITNADGGITNWRVSGAGGDIQKKRQIAKAIKRLNTEKKPVEVKSENGTTNTAANLENELTNKIVQDGEVVNRASEAVPPKSTAQPESIPDVPAEPQYVIRPEDWPSRFERMLSEIDKDEAQARSFLASDPDRFNLARHYGHENFWDNITMLNRGRGRGEITQKQYDAWRKELETRRNESRKRLDAEVEANAEKELKELMGDAQEMSGQKQTSKPKTYTAVEDALGRTWVNSQEAADAGIQGYSTLKTLTDKIRFGMRDAAQGTKLRMQALWEKVLSSVPDKAKDLGKKILPASPKQTIADIIDFISTPRMPLGKGRILTPELRNKMRNVFSENAKKLEEAALQTKKEKIDLAAQGKSAFDDLLKAERERNSALQQFNEDPKTKEYNALEDILTEAKRIFDVENNKPITPETGGNESLARATKNLDDAKSTVNKFLVDNPGFAAKKRVVDNTRNLFETAKQKYKDTTGESYTDKLSSNNIEDVITNGFNVNTRSQRPITLDSTGNMHIPLSTEFVEGLDSGRYYGIGSGYTLNKGFLGRKPEIIVPKGKEITLKDVMNPSNQHTFNPDDVPLPDIVASKAKGGSRAKGNARSSKPSEFWSFGANLDHLTRGPLGGTGPLSRVIGTPLNLYVGYQGLKNIPNVPGALQEEYKEHYGTERGPVSWGDWALQIVPDGIYNASDMSRLQEPKIKVKMNSDGSVEYIDAAGIPRRQVLVPPAKATAPASGSAAAPASGPDTGGTYVDVPVSSGATDDEEEKAPSENSDFNFGNWMTKNVVPEYFSNKENFGSYGHSLFGALAGGALGAGIGGLNYILTDENELSEEEKKKRSLARAMLSSAGIGAGIGGLVGGASDYTRA